MTDTYEPEQGTLAQTATMSTGGTEPLELLHSANTCDTGANFSFYTDDAGDSAAEDHVSTIKVFPRHPVDLNPEHGGRELTGLFDELIRGTFEDTDDVAIVGVIGNHNDTIVNVVKLLMGGLERQKLNMETRTVSTPTLYAVACKATRSVYLFLRSPSEDRVLERARTMPIQTVLEKAEAAYAEALLTVLLVADVVLSTHATPAFDAQFIKALRAAQTGIKTGIKNQVVAAIRAALEEKTKPSKTMVGARNPVLLFLYVSPDPDVHAVSLARELNSQTVAALRVSGLGNTIVHVPSSGPISYVVPHHYLTTADASFVNTLLTLMQPKGVGSGLASGPPNLGDDIRGRVLKETKASRRSSSEACLSLNSTFHLLSQKEQSLRNKIKTVAGAGTKYSETSCTNALAQARVVYEEDTPPMYSAAVHESRMGKAVVLLKSLGSGPALPDAIRTLERECEGIWNNGRRLCGSLSLTGRPCVLGAHPVPSDSSTSEPEAITMSRSRDRRNPKAGVARPHVSSYRTYAACNCGRTRRPRDDPFSLKVANCEFFVAPCCVKSIHHRFPTKAEPLPYAKEDVDRSAANCKALPEFSSWFVSLVTMANQYQPSTGLSLEGFGDKARSLLTWDAFRPQTTGTRDARPAKYAEDFARHILKQQGGRDDTADIDTPVVRCNVKGTSKEDRARYIGRFYVGCEYECPHGHRFIAPIDKGSEAVTSAYPPSDIPLYHACPCKDKGSLALLQRMYIATPDTVEIGATVNPRVQFVSPAKEGSNVERVTFAMGQDIALPRNALVCVRLPYVYLKGNTPLVQSTASSPYQARLLQGAIQVLPKPPT